MFEKLFLPRSMSHWWLSHFTHGLKYQSWKKNIFFNLILLLLLISLFVHHEFAWPWWKKSNSAGPWEAVWWETWKCSNWEKVDPTNLRYKKCKISTKKSPEISIYLYFIYIFQDLKLQFSASSSTSTDRRFAFENETKPHELEPFIKHEISNNCFIQEMIPWNNSKASPATGRRFC